MIHQRKMSHTLRCIILVTVFLLFSACAEDGSVLFAHEGCIQCHSFKGKGGNMAPDLTAVTNRRSDRWIRQQIKNPRKNNPDSRMPAFGHLSGSEIRAILRYLKS
jgi:cbb3-type cytochrome oxidase cytochrome c subunit